MSTVLSVIPLKHFNLYYEVISKAIKDKIEAKDLKVKLGNVAMPHCGMLTNSSISKVDA